MTNRARRCVDELQQAVVSDLDEASEGFVAVEFVEDVGDAADAASVGREVLKGGGHQLLMVLKNLGEEVAGFEHCDLAGVDVPR